MGFNFMSLFVEQPSADNNQKESVAANPSTPQISVTPSVVTNTTVPVTTVNKETTQVNQEILDKLCAHIENFNLPGPDYIELRKAANSEGMMTIPDESVRLQAAFATLKSMHPNFSKDTVLKSIDTYVAELRKQNDIAKAQIESKRKSEVEDRKKEIKEKEKRIEELQQEILSITNELSVMKEDVSATDAECDKNISEFEYAVNLIIGNLETDKAKIAEKLVG